MSDSNEIRAGGAYVELNAKTNDASFKKEEKGIVDRMRDLGGRLTSMGAAVAAMGVAAAAPLLSAARAYEQYGATISKMSTRTGLGADMVVAAREISEETGAPMRAVAKALAAMQRGESNEQTKWLQSMNLPIAEMVAEAKVLGNALDDAGTKRAGEFYKAMKRGGDAVEGLKFAIADGLMPTLMPLVNRFVDVVLYTQQLVRDNPELIQQWAKMAGTLVLMGTAMAAVGATIMAATSPAFVLSGLVVGVGAAILAVTDVVGGTDMGFGDLFNSIRVGGVGLGTWMAGMVHGLIGLWITLGERVRSALYFVSNAADFIASQKQIKMYEDMRHQAIERGQMNFAAGMGKMAHDLEAQLEERMSGRSAASQAQRDDANREFEAVKKTVVDMFEKDYLSGANGPRNGVDTEKLKGALVKIGDTVFGSLGGFLESLFANIPRQRFDAGGGAGQGFGMSGGGVGIAGTFNTYGAGSLGVTGVLSKIEANTRKTAENTGEVGEARAGG